MGRKKKTTRGELRPLIKQHGASKMHRRLSEVQFYRKCKGKGRVRKGSIFKKGKRNTVKFMGISLLG